MIKNSELGRALRQRRVMVPLTLQELAEKSGVSPSHIGRIERGDRFPSARILSRLAKPLGFGEDEMLTLAGFRSPSEAEVPSGGHLDPYVAGVLSQEPVEVQRALISILTILSITRTYDWGFAEYVRRKYPKIDEDTITMIQDMLEHPPKG